MQDQVERNLGWSAEYDAIGDATAFATQQVSATFGGLTLSAIAHTPIRTRVSSDELTFFLPVDGGPIQSTVNDEYIACAVGEAALLAPEGDRIGTGESRSIVAATLDRRRLLKTARAMTGDGALRLDWQRPTVLPLAAAGINLDLMIRSACRMLDACNLNGAAAASLGIDETIYRAVSAMLLRDRLFAPAEKPPVRPGVDRRLELACQYIMAHLESRIALTDLEVVSGLSTRALQYGFQNRFGCSPVTWIRNERLNAARSRLLLGGEGMTVTEVALSFGFSGLSAFSRYYLERFGEKPSETLAGTRARY